MRNHSEDGAKLNLRWMRGVFVRKLDRTDEFLLLAPTGAMKTRCVRRVEGDNAWDLQFFNLCVGSPWNATAKSTPQGPTIQQQDELASRRRAKRLYLRQNVLDKYGRTRGCPGCVGIGQHTEDCRARIEKMLDRGDAIELETCGNQEEIVEELDVSLKNRKIGDPDVNPGSAASLTAETPKRGESEHESSAESKNLLAGCIAAVKDILCDMPSVDFSQDRTAQSGSWSRT